MWILDRYENKIRFFLIKIKIKKLKWGKMGKFQIGKNSVIIGANNIYR